MTFDMEVDDFLGLIDVQDLTAVVEVIEASMTPQKNGEQETTHHLNGTK